MNIIQKRMKFLLLCMVFVVCIGNISFASEQDTGSCLTSEMVEQYTKDGSLDERTELYNAVQEIPNTVKSGATTSNGGMPTKGDVKGIVLLVDFPNDAHRDENTPTVLKERFNRKLNTFYQNASYGKMDLSVDIAPEWYTATNDRSYYESLAEEQGEFFAWESLLQETMQAMDEEIDFSKYDSDGDGYADAVYLVFAGSDNGWGNLWWSFKINTHYDTAADDTDIAQYVLLSESHCDESSMTVVHETGHLLGLKDLYDAQNGSTFTRFGTNHDMMYDNSGDINAYSKIILGWIEPRVITDVQSVTLKPSTSNAEAVVVYPKGNTKSEQFFVIEYVDRTKNRANVGKSQGLENGGVRIWRINTSVDQNIRGQVSFQTAEPDYGGSNGGYWTGKSDYTPYTMPSSYIYRDNSNENGPFLYSGVSVTDICVDGDCATMNIGVEEEKQKKEFTYKTEVQLSNRIDVCVMFDTEIYIEDKRKITVKNNNTILDANIYVSYDESAFAAGEAYRYQKLKMEIHDIENLTGEVQIIIPADIIMNSYEVYNEEIILNVDLSDMCDGNSYTDNIGSMFSEGQTFNVEDCLYYFIYDEEQGELFRIKKNYEGKELERLEILKSSDAHVSNTACILEDNSFVVCVKEESSNERILYHVSLDGNVEKIGDFEDMGGISLFPDGTNLILMRDYELFYVDIAKKQIEKIMDYHDNSTVSYLGSGTLMYHENKFYEDDSTCVIELYNVHTGETVRKNYNDKSVFGDKEGIVSAVRRDKNSIVILSQAYKDAQLYTYFTVLDNELNVIDRTQKSFLHYGGVREIYRIPHGYVVEEDRVENITFGAGEWDYLGTSATVARIYDEEWNIVGSYCFGGDLTCVDVLSDGRIVISMCSYPTKYYITDGIILKKYASSFTTNDVEKYYSHTGEAIAPITQVFYADELLVEGDDYEIAYDDNISVGTCTATITGKGDYIGSKEINFDICNEVESISIEPKDAVVGVGMTLQLSAVVSPETASPEVVWSTADENIAKVDETGMVSGVAVGIVEITATEKDGTIKGTVEVEVKDYSPTSITLDKKEITLKVGESYQLNATILPTEAPDKSVIWSLDNTGIVSVTDGKVTALAVGQVNVFAITCNNQNAFCKVTVVDSNTPDIEGEMIPVESVVIEPLDDAYLEVGQSVQLKASVLPENATNKNIEWASSNVEIATVDVDGKVTGIAEGTVYITATATDGTGINTTYEIVIGEQKCSHVEEIDKAVPATCTKTGLTEGKHCSLCGETILKQEVVEVLGHEFSKEWTVDQDATCAEAGNKSHHCVREGCSEKTDVTEIPATGQHSYSDWVQTKKPQCDKDGQKIRICATCTHQETEKIPATGFVKGGEFTKANNIYTIKTVKGKKGTIVYEGPTKNNKKTVKIPKTIKVKGKTYTVTEISAEAFKGNTKLKSVTIPEGVTKIGKEAFSGCKNLKTITIKSSKLKTVGKNAIKGIHKKATIKVPKKKLTKYKKLFKTKTGYKKSMKIKKN